MRRLGLALAALIIFILSTVAPVLAGDVSVHGYFRQDGTYVQPHMRSAPDSSFNNNWSTYPNVNPYTGQQGTRQPRLFDYNGSNNNLGGSDYGLGGASKQRSRW